MISPLMNLTSQGAVACLRTFYFAACLFLAGYASAQTIVYSFDPVEGSGTRLNSLGIDSTGGVWMIGDDSLVRFTGDGFETTSLPMYPHRISRDAQYIIGTAFDPEAEDTREMLVRRTEPTVGISLGEFLTTVVDSEDAMDVATTPDGPLVVGKYGFGTFLWTERNGYRAWMTNSSYLPLRWPYAMSADGKKWAGVQLSVSGTQVVLVPFAGTETSLELLDLNGASTGYARGISPNGEYIVGIAGLQGTIWSKKKVRTLTAGTGQFKRDTVFRLDAVTDHGFAGGTANPGDGIIYDSRGQKVELFDKWWSRNYPAVPLPAHVRRVRDLQEHGDNLYFLIDLEFAGSAFFPTALAIAPLKCGKK